MCMRKAIFDFVLVQYPLFITPLSPWHGGFWERMVRSVKTPLRKICSGANLKEVELRTLLTQIEATINDRPIGGLQGDENGRVLTPFDLLAGRPRGQAQTTKDQPEVVFGAAHSRRISHLQTIHEQFWRQWRQQYLPTLQRRGKWTANYPNVKEGDIVLLLKEGQKRHTWPLAKVVETLSGRDGLVRSVKLLCDEKEITRPIQLIVPLEVPTDQDNVEL